MRAFDTNNPHATEFDAYHSNLNLTFAPGTMLEFTFVRPGEPDPPQRVVVGTTSPQVVALQ